MSNLAVALKDEIRRLAKKEVKALTGSTKDAVVQYRRDIARLKRQVQDQQRKLAFLESQEKKRISKPRVAEESLENVRFSARSVRAQRKRLGLSAEDYAKLLGVSALTVYNWEHGKSRPRQAQFAGLIALRGIGRREAMRRLELLDEKS